MSNKKEVEAWVKNGIISAEQGEKILAQSSEINKEEKANKMVTTLSVLGSVFLGLGAILFVASHWSEMGDFSKTAILFIGTFGFFFLSLFLSSKKGALPRAGAAFLLLSALLFGASIFLIAQIYNIEADSHFLIILWFLGVLPLVYVLKNSVNAAIPTLAILIYYAWVGFFVFSGERLSLWGGSDRSEDYFLFLPVIYAIHGVFVFSVGSLHYLSDKLTAIARQFRLSGLFIAMLSIFLLTFQFFSGKEEGLNVFFRNDDFKIFEDGKILTLMIVPAVLGIIFTISALSSGIPKRKTHTWEHLANFAVFALCWIFFIFPPAAGNVYTIIFNLFFVGLVILLFYIGYQNEDMKVVNSAFSWVSIFIIARYFDFFWKLLPRSLFFMVGGAILIGGGIFIESKRKQLKKEFKAKI